jgi:hypothetical protein
MARWPAGILGLTGILLAAASVVVYGWSRLESPIHTLHVTPLAPPTVVQSPEGRLFRYVVENRSDGPVRLLGCTDGCRPTGCVVATDEYPLDVPPGGSVTLGFVWHPRDGTTGREVVRLYTSGPGQLAIDLDIGGL